MDSREQQANVFLQGKPLDERDKTANVFLNPRQVLSSRDSKVIAQQNTFLNHMVDPRDKTAGAFLNNQLDLDNMPENIRKQYEAFTGNGPQAHSSANDFMQGYED